MLMPPRDLSVEVLLDTVTGAFGIEVGSLQYLPVGFGSHHWADGARWFPVAPRLTLQGQPLVQIDGRFSVAVYPFVEGAAGRFSDTFDDDTATSIVGHLAELHALQTADGRSAPFRHLPPPEELRPTSDGPFGATLGNLLDTHMAALRTTYEQLWAAESDSCVSTHGEPHPGNWITTHAGLRLVDWDTARTAPPERDIWLVARRRAWTLWACTRS